MCHLIDADSDWTKSDWFRDLQDTTCYQLVAIAGIPGSGKSTFAKLLSENLADSIVIPMDGYHLPRRELSPRQMARRGAPDTFDPRTLKADLERWKTSRAGSFPAFDHAKKDPEPGAITITSSHRIVIVEGLYLFLPNWEISELFDVRLFLECDLEIAMNRLVKRHVETGICKGEAEARERVEENDRKNAELVGRNAKS